MIGALLSIFSGAIGLGKSILGYQEKKLDTNLEGFKTASGIDGQAYSAYLNAVVAVNGQKLAANAWWGAKMIIFTAGWAASLQFTAIMLDSMPFWIPFIMTEAHVVGSWQVPNPPPPYDGYQRDISLVSAVSQWLGRK